MFYYYGGKRRLARFYPAPQHDVIVEPFAGSAAYALRHLDPSTRAREVKRVILVEKDQRVVDMWKRLLAMDPAELLKFPIPKAGERTDDRVLIGRGRARGGPRVLDVVQQQDLHRTDHLAVPTWSCGASSSTVVSSA